MGVKFLNQNIVVNSTRPTGFKFPIGLSGTAANTTFDYLVVAGAGAGAADLRADDVAPAAATGLGACGRRGDRGGIRARGAGSARRAALGHRARHAGVRTGGGAVRRADPDRGRADAGPDRRA